MKEGKIIVVAGTDSSGKKTQADLLVEKLKQLDYSVFTMDFPRYKDESSVFVRRYLGKGCPKMYGPSDSVDPKVASMFYALDRYNASFEIRDHLKNGEVVVLDRYVSANKGHQGGKLIDKPISLDKYLTWLDDLEFNMMKIPRPDVNITLYVPPEVSIALNKERVKKDGEAMDGHESNTQHITNAAKAYEYLCNRYDYWKRIDCTEKGKMLSIPTIHDKVCECALEVLRK